MDMTMDFISEAEQLGQRLLAPIESDADAEDDPLTDYNEGRESAMSQLGPGAIEPASFEDDVDHSPGLSWHTNLSIFVVPIPDVKGGFALLVLDWDDNWGRREWRCEAALGGAGSRDAATAALLEKLRADYADGASPAFRAFLNSLS